MAIRMKIESFEKNINLKKSENIGGHYFILTFPISNVRHLSVSIFAQTSVDLLLVIQE